MVCPSPGACSREAECLDVCLMQTKDQLPNYLLLLLLTVCCSAARFDAAPTSALQHCHCAAVPCAAVELSSNSAPSKVYTVLQ